VKFNKRDANEHEIIDALVRCGCLVHRVTREPFDLVVTRGGRIHLLEVKNGPGRLKRSQLDFLQMGWPLHVVRTPEDALRAVL
jgi:hypothetical protein